jgi:hypothetical protein
MSRDLLLGVSNGANADFNQSGGTVNVARNVVVAAFAASGMTASRYGSFGLEKLGGREAVRARLLAEAPGGGFADGLGLARAIEAALGKPS